MLISSKLEFDAGHLEKLRPADAIDPFADALVLAGVVLPDVDYVDDRLDHFRPPRRIVLDVRYGQLREHLRGYADPSWGPEPRQTCCLACARSGASSCAILAIPPK